MGDGNVTDKQQAAPADWPENWRAKLAGDDTDTLKRLEKQFQTPADVWKHMRALELRQSELKKPLPDNPTPEQVAEYRKENNIPEAPDKYDLTLPEGFVIGEQDKPLVNEFLKDMHAANASQETVKHALAAYYKLVGGQQAQIEEQDTNFRSSSEDALRNKWGGDFKRNVNMVTSLLSMAPEGVKDRILGGRTAEGRLMGDDPGVLEFLNALAREVNPASTVVSGAGPQAIEQITTELAELQKKMGDKSSDYWRGPLAEKNQARFRELVDVQQKIKSRAA